MRKSEHGSEVEGVGCRASRDALRAVEVSLACSLTRNGNDEYYCLISFCYASRRVVLVD